MSAIYAQDLAEGATCWVHDVLERFSQKMVISSHEVPPGEVGVPQSIHDEDRH